MTELALIYDTLQKARCPEDVFGASVKTSFRQLARAVHPDFNGGDPLASKAAELLNHLKHAADERMAAGTWGQRRPLPEYELAASGGGKAARL